MSTASLPSVAPHVGTTGDRGPAADVEIVIPVYNEAEQLSTSVTALRTYLDTSFPLTTTVTIVDNASTDGTWPIAVRLAGRPARRGGASTSIRRDGAAPCAPPGRPARQPVVAYMDVDLATGPRRPAPLGGPPALRPQRRGHRHPAGPRGPRGARRPSARFISRGYNLLLRATLRSPCTDAQCGFKALRREAAAELLPLVEDEEWFFDTEVPGHRPARGLRIHEVPVDWVDDLDSRVDVVRTALADLRGVWRMLGGTSRQRPGVRPTRATPSSRVPNARSGRAPAELSLVPPGAPSVGGVTAGPRGAVTDAGRPDHPTVFADELLRFAGVGAVSTLAYAALFAALEPGVGGYLASAVAIVAVQSRQHRRPPGYGRHRASWDRPAASPGGGRRPARRQPGGHHGRPGDGARARHRLPAPGIDGGHRRQRRRPPSYGSPYSARGCSVPGSVTIPASHPIAPLPAPGHLHPIPRPGPTPRSDPMPAEQDLPMNELNTTVDPGAATTATVDERSL